MKALLCRTQKLNNCEILKPTRPCEGGLLISVLDEIYCAFAGFGDFCAVLRFLIGPYAPLFSVSIVLSFDKGEYMNHSRLQLTGIASHLLRLVRVSKLLVDRLKHHVQHVIL